MFRLPPVEFTFPFHCSKSSSSEESSSPSPLSAILVAPSASRRSSKSRAILLKCSYFDKKDSQCTATYPDNNDIFLQFYFPSQIQYISDPPNSWALFLQQTSSRRIPLHCPWALLLRTWQPQKSRMAQRRDLFCMTSEIQLKLNTMPAHLQHHTPPNQPLKHQSYEQWLRLTTCWKNLPLFLSVIHRISLPADRQPKEARREQRALTKPTHPRHLLLDLFLSSHALCHCNGCWHKSGCFGLLGTCQIIDRLQRK